MNSELVLVNSRRTGGSKNWESNIERQIQNCVLVFLFLLEWEEEGL